MTARERANPARRARTGAVTGEDRRDPTASDCGGGHDSIETAGSANRGAPTAAGSASADAASASDGAPSARAQAVAGEERRAPAGARRGRGARTPQRRLSPEARREQIVSAARAVIVRQGLGATSLRDIAAEAAVSMGTVTYHFDGIDEILGAVVIAESTKFYADVVEAADAEPDALKALRLLIDPMFAESTEVDSHWRVWTDYWAAISRRPGMNEAYAGRIRHWERCTARVIARGVADGTFREVDPAEAALKLAAYSDGLATQRAQGVVALTRETARTWFEEFAWALLAPH